ncbi:tetratricopeptide repeat protein [Clostridium sp. OM02-18AC]|uniref:tetratricopeptide repeat protein n=1 Tax=Clostridium sp. OM02-18AC TaxID=2292311 RepID=UPI000E4BCAAB|nr:tetratricopeptide repeat protein [Clostridium sp. OM02-18AC]RHV62981.1 tetratricopeptide repeat protein [Clostridium sp. OM02-18AC]
MDKYEFNIKVEQIRKLSNQGDFETAMKIADTIDWKKVRNANLLSMVANVYEKNHEYQDAKDILLMAFERAPIGKRLLYKLTDLALKEGNVEEANAYYREFCDLAGDDPRQHLLRYMILKAMDAPIEQQIHSLEGYTEEELDEKWLYELAELYHRAGDAQRCVAACDKIMLMFGLGKYVDKAMELKVQYAPLNKYQMDLVENRDKYEEKLRAVEQAFEEEDAMDDEPETDVQPEAEQSGNAAEETDAEAEAELASEVVSEVPAPADAVQAVPEEQNLLKEAAVKDVDEENTEAPEVNITPDLSYGKEAIVAQVQQAETEAQLAKEVSRIGKDAVEEESDLGKTRVLDSIRRMSAADAARKAETEAAEPEIEEIDEFDEEPELPRMTNHLMIEARSPEKGMEIAIQTLKQIQKETGIKNPVAKITGSKLNKRGILACADKLSGKDLMIEEAGDLTPQMIGELETLMTRDTSGMRIILIDNPKQMEMLHAQNPSLADKFECIGCDYPPVQAAEPEVAAAEPESMAEPERESNFKQAERPVRKVVPTSNGAMRAPEPELEASEQEAAELAEPAEEAEMDIDEFAQYCCKYASEIDCSITGKSMLALYERIEIMEEDGIPLTRKEAQALIEEAADRAEKPSLGKAIKGLFSSKYDKDGMLILKEEHFI